MVRFARTALVHFDSHEHVRFPTHFACFICVHSGLAYTHSKSNMCVRTYYYTTESIRSFSLRTQCVKIAKWVPLRFTPCRVWCPPRKYLGPTSFVLYINDLPDALSSAALPYLFADDTKCLHVSSSQSDQILLQNDINTLHTYSNS